MFTRPKDRLVPGTVLLLLTALATAPAWTLPVLAADETSSASIAALPAFRHQGVVLDYQDLNYNPCNDVMKNSC